MLVFVGKLLVTKGSHVILGQPEGCLKKEIKRELPKCSCSCSAVLLALCSDSDVLLAAAENQDGDN